MLSLITFILAIICYSIIETLIHHFSISIFSKLDPKWWNPTYSWKRKYEMKPTLFNKYISVIWSDAYHLFKFIFLILTIASIVTYQTLTTFYIDLVIYWIVYSIVFNLFYGKLLLRV